jgi:hypothetical protein
MLSEETLETLAEMIPAKSTYAVIVPFNEISDPEDLRDLKLIRYFDDWTEACDAKRELESEGIIGYLIEPEGVVDDIEI